MVLKFKLTAPVLYLAFNRLDSVKKTFPEIQKAKPKQLFIACDGPRNKGEKEKTNAVRKYILENINWKCEVKTLFRDKNLGCKYAVAGAIDWFFENVEKGIILEDDCLPDQSFFRFCQEMLEKYKDNEKVMSISGQNALGQFDIQESYLFSKYFFCWGWATWKRAWEKMDVEMTLFKKYTQKDVENILPKFIERKLWAKRFRDNLFGNIDSWATSFLFSHLHNKGLCIIPKKNIVKNIGFSNDNSTHTKENYWDKRYLYRERKTLIFPLKHPEKITVNEKIMKSILILNLKRIFLKKVFSKVS